MYNKCHPTAQMINPLIKNNIELDLEKRKNGEIQAAKVDLTKTSIKTLAEKIGVLSEDVKMYMYLPNAKRYYALNALNDRTISLPMKGNADMSATTVETDEGDKGTFSDAEVQEIAKLSYL